MGRLVREGCSFHYYYRSKLRIVKRFLLVLCHGSWDPELLLWEAGRRPHEWCGHRRSLPVVPGDPLDQRLTERAAAHAATDHSSDPADDGAAPGQIIALTAIVRA